VNITYNTTAEGDNAIITVTATITNQGVMPAENFSSFLFFGLYKNESGCEVLPGYYGADNVSKGERWVNRSYAGAKCICVHVNRTWRFVAGKEISEVEKGDIKIVDKNGNKIAEPTEPCCIPVMGDTVNVSVRHGEGQGVEIFFYAGEINSTENVSLDVSRNFTFSMTKRVGKGIYTACVHADVGGNVTEHDERNNFEVKELKVLPDFTVSNISIAFNGTEVKEVKEGEPVFINVSIKNEGLIRGIADVEVVEESEWIDISPRFELTPFGYPYGYGYVIRHPDADAIMVQFKTLNVIPKGAPNNDTRGVVYIRNESGVEKEWWGYERSGPANSSWITGDTIYVYAPTKCGDLSGSKVVIDKYRWMKRIANFSDMELQAKETENITVEWNPDDAGPRTIRVVVDHDNETLEINKANNELNRGFHVEPCEDPAVVNISFDPPSPVPRNSTNISVTACIANYGTKTANFSVDLWALKEEIYHYNSTHPTEGFNETITTYPEADWTGIHFEKIRLDNGSITRRMKVDDSHKNTSAYFNSFNGDDLWTWVKGNAAKIEMVPFDSYYDRETTLAGGGRSVWGCKVNKVSHKIILNHTTLSLGPGNSTNVSGVLPNVRAGNGSLSYTIYAVVDRDNVIYELSEANNRKEETLNIAIPDLTVSDIKYDGGQPEAVIENIGYAPADNVTVRFIRDVGTSDKEYPPFKAESDGIYSISQEDADVMRVHVKELYVVEGKNGSLKIGTGAFWDVYEKDDDNGFWSSWIAGDSISLILNKGRYKIDKYEYGVDEPDTPFEIDAGEEYRRRVPFTAENEIYNLTVFVDPEDRVEESNEWNNKMEKMMGPDLTFVFPGITFLNVNRNEVQPDKLIARENHTVRVKVKNAGCVAATNFSVALYVNKSYNATYSEPIAGFPQYEQISRLDPGAWTERDFQWTPMDGFYRVKVVVDENNNVPELNEGNNIYSSDEVKAGEPGYKAKQSPLTIYERGTLNGGIIYVPYCYYVCPDPNTNSSFDYVANFDINLPQNATVEIARLYLYVWGDKMDPEHPGFRIGCQPDVSMKFNNILVNDKRTTYEDTSGATAENYTYTTYCYNVKPACDGVNWHAEAHFTRNEPMRFAVNGMALLVVYRDNDALLTSYWIGEGSDVIMAKNMKFPTGFEFNECERKCVFEGMSDAQKANASLLTVLAPYATYDPYSPNATRTLHPEAGDKGDLLLFEGFGMREVGSLMGTTTGHWEYRVQSTIAFTENEWEYVEVREGTNTAAIQSRGNYLVVKNAILKVTYPPDLEPSLEKAPPKVVIGNSYNIPIVINNVGKSRAKDFNVSFYATGGEPRERKEHVVMVEGNGSITKEFQWRAPLTPGTVEFKVVVDPDNDVEELINGYVNGELNNNATKTVTVGLGELIPPLHPGGGSGTGGGWGEGTGTGEGSGSGEGIGTAGGSGESGAGESGGKTITGRLMKGRVVSGKEAGGGGKGEFSLIAWLIRLAMLAAAVVLVCVGYLMERRRQRHKQ
jgi:subtilase family serine protease